MAYYDDLAPCDYFGATERPLLAIGWLDNAHDYSKGKVRVEHFEALASLLVDAWQPFVVAGSHSCGFCVFTGGPAVISVGTLTIELGAKNLFVPSAEGLYVAPSLIMHYIDAHQYAPPDEWWLAVKACPPMRSSEYLRAIAKHGISALIRSGTV